MTSDYRTNSIGTMDWLQATAHLKIRAYTEHDETPYAQYSEAPTSHDFSDKRSIPCRNRVSFGPAKSS